MNFYHTWVYEYFLNAAWFLWVIVFFVLGCNILAPVFVWFLMSSKKIPFIGKRKAKQGQAT